jgi:ubiquilin
MGPPPDPDAMLNMLENPQVQATMNEALQNPALIDMMIQQNPMLRDMGPGVRQMMQSPEFRRMLTDPAAIRQMAQMQRAFGGMGGGMGLGGGPGNAAFPAPGVTNTTPEENRGQQQTGDNAAGDTGAAPTVNPFGAAGNPFSALFGMNPQNQPPLAPSITPSTGAEQNTGANAPSGQTVTDPSTQNQQAQNPFAALFNPALFGAPPTQPGADAGAGAQAGNFNPFNPQTNPLLRDPAMLSNMMQAMGGGGGGGGQFGGGNGGAAANPWASMFGAPPAAPVDNRPPEERYEEQLRSLNDMGFCEFERNIEALRASGGSVQGAVEYLLSHLS